MVDRPKDREAEFLRERAAKLREIAADMPPDTRRQLIEVAEQLQRRADKFEGNSPPRGPAQPAAA